MQGPQSVWTMLPFASSFCPDLKRTSKKALYPKHMATNNSASSKSVQFAAPTEWTKFPLGVRLSSNLYIFQKNK